MGQQPSTSANPSGGNTLERLCCNNNLCNFDSNVENLTEVNRRNNPQGMGGANGYISDEMLIRGGA